MKLVYTNIEENLPAHLAKMAADYAKAGHRVFYIAPNSLSFEKERSVLERLDGQASFDVMVTRFGQMARYFILNEPLQGQSMDDIGLSMLFFRVLSQMEDTDLHVYGKLKQDMNFIEQLVSLYKEMQVARVHLADLEALTSAEKAADLRLIFSRFAEFIQQDGYASETKIAQFTRLIGTGQLDAELGQVVLIVDGYTRFSAEEEALLLALNGRVADIVIGTYASRKAYAATYIAGSLYQAGVDFLRHLAQLFTTKPLYIEVENQTAETGQVAKWLESHYDFSEQKPVLTEEDRSHISIWQAINQKEEVEAVARAIRQELAQGKRYKDILVLLGDVEGYQLQLSKTFEKFDIPYYLGKAEKMSHHPLVHFVESLERLKRYNFRAEDMLNLLKSGLFGNFTQVQLDKFEQYVLFADIKGQSKFLQDFQVNSRAKYDLEALNSMRRVVMEPIQELFKAQPQSGRSLLQKLMQFFESIEFTKNMANLSADYGQLALEKEEEVWKAFTHILEVTDKIFGQEKLRLDDFLALLRSGMLTSQYRVVPATVDVVNVRSYDLIEPHSKKIVYAIGMGQANFPKQVKNTSILTDEERQQINESSEGQGRFEIISQENTKKNHFVFLSLVQSATEKLVLSAPQIFKEAEDNLSPYLRVLIEMGVQVQEKGRSKSLSADDIGHYKGLLSHLIEANREDLDQEWQTDLTKEDQTFWAVAVRYLRKKLEKEGISIPTISSSIPTKKLDQETLDVLFPLTQPLQLSSSSLTDFYQNEYLYFLRHILHLEEQESVRPDARSHGNFLHRIFERVMTDGDSDFDRKLSRAITQTRQETAFQALYNNDAEAQFSENMLVDIAQATSLVLRDDSVVKVIEDEAVFGKDNDNLLLLDNGRAVNIKGKIDRLDAIQSDGALGVVDYKSSSKSFKLDQFYNGLSPQLLTYIAAIKNHPEYSQTEKVFGAMYLHMLDPVVKLKDIKDADGTLAEAYKSLVYKGLFLEEESNRLNQLYYKTKSTLFTEEELAILLEHNQHLYQDAAKKIFSGSFAINPYTEDGKSVAGDQLKAITGFEANLHLGQARHLVKGGKKEEWLARMQVQEGMQENTNQKGGH